MPLLAKLLAVAAVIYLVIAGLLYFKQRQILYLPDRNIGTPAQYGLNDFKELTLKGEAGALQAWYIPPARDMPLVLYLHGNGGHLGYRNEIFRALADAGYGVLALEWRGYGKSDGQPTEAGLIADARTALAYLQQELKHPPARLIYFGESLGTGVAVRLATETPPAMLVLRTPYTSIAGRAQEIYYWLPVSLLIKDRFDTLPLIPSLHAPLLIVHGTQDSIIPAAHGKKLYDAAHEPKRFVLFEGDGHNDLDMRKIIVEMEKFARRNTE